MEGAFLKQRNELFSKIHREYYKKLCYYAENFVLDKEIAENIVSALFFKLLETKPDMAGVGSIKAFLFTSVRNACINHLRQARFDQPISPDLEDGHAGEEAGQYIREGELIDKITLLLKTLPEKQRFVLEQLFYKNKTHKMIASDLRTSLQNVYQTEARGLRAIFEEVRNDPRLLLVLVALFP